MSRLNELIKSDRSLFHTSDLAIIWKISNRHTLKNAIDRYIKQGILTRIYKGFYTTKNPTQLDPLELGAAACQTYTYLSTESVLADTGVIPQIIRSYTFISSKSYHLTINQHQFHYRQLADQFLFNQTGITQQPNGVFIASAERAAADLLYFNPKYQLDLIQSLDQNKIIAIQHQLGYL